jgi:hypothetical protein
MGRQRAAAGTPLLGPLAPQCRIACLGFGLDKIQEIQLVGRALDQGDKAIAAALEDSDREAPGLHIRL